MLKEGTVLKDRYEILKVIGKGGMSTVYQAKDLQTGNLLAVKNVMRAEQNTTDVVEQSLAAEGRMLKQLENDHLPKIYDIIEQPDSFTLVMDFIEGESMDRVLLREGAQPVEQVLTWGMQICEVFSYLHNLEVPIIYRDMKPANIMKKPDGQLMMIDFGTARTEKKNVEMQADTICIGTEGFAAPEQYGGQGQSTARTDIFCLGATLYNMVTGHSPCDRPVGILPLGTWIPELKNSPIQHIITKCTRSDPDERYQNAQELYEDLHLASMGKLTARGGKSGSLGGWQKNDVKALAGIGSGFSGLLEGITSTFSKNTAGLELPKTEKIWTPAPQTRLNTNPMQPEIISQTTNTEPDPIMNSTVCETPETEQNPLHRMILPGFAVGAVFLIFGLVLLALKQITAGAVFCIIALSGAALAAAGLVMDRKSGPDSIIDSGR